MMVMKLKLLAADFDNTFFTEEDYKENIESANRFVNNGNIFVIATGRYLEYILRDIQDTGLNYSYLICNDGGIIFDRSFNVIFRRDMPREIGINIINLFKQCDFLNQPFIDDGIKISDTETNNINGIFCNFKDMNKAKSLLALIRCTHGEVDGYLTPHLNIVIREKNVNKGYAIKQLTGILNIDKKDVYTIGDSINDESMSDYDFNCYRMTNSVSELKDKTIEAYSSVHQLIKKIQ
jgi:HAD superfamily hydrolase (TIGR01484 family)